MFLFSRFCSDANEQGFATGLLSDFTKLRTDLIRHLVHMGLSDFKVMDTCCTTACAPMANIPDRLAKLKKVVARDGIHFAEGGQKNLALRTISCLKTLLSVQKKPPKNTTFFWRGFRSQKGLLASKNASGIAGREHGAATRWALHGRGRGSAHVARSRVFHPYRRW
jgi:hypothetical protein